jgi:hypothetical protein
LATPAGPRQGEHHGPADAAPGGRRLDPSASARLRRPPAGRRPRTRGTAPHTHGTTGLDTARRSRARRTGPRSGGTARLGAAGRTRTRARCPRRDTDSSTDLDPAGGRGTDAAGRGRRAGHPCGDRARPDRDLSGGRTGARRLVASDTSGESGRRGARARRTAAGGVVGSPDGAGKGSRRSRRPGTTGPRRTRSCRRGMVAPLRTRTSGPNTRRTTRPRRMVTAVRTRTSGRLGPGGSGRSRL